MSDDKNHPQGKKKEKKEAWKALRGMIKNKEGEEEGTN